MRRCDWADGDRDGADQVREEERENGRTAAPAALRPHLIKPHAYTPHSSGIGRETAACLARRGATVVLACRDTARGDALAAQLASDASTAGLPPPSTLVRRLDVADLDSVRAFARTWGGAPLHSLVCNAGVFAMGDATRRTAQGTALETHAVTNHLGHFLLTLLLLPALARTGTPSSPARIVHVSSKLHEFAAGEDLAADPLTRRSYTPLAAYARSKLAQVVFTAELRRRLSVLVGGVKKEGDSSPPTVTPSIVVTAVHPGEVMTDVVRSLPSIVQAAYRAIMTSFLLSPCDGARSSVWAATDTGVHDAPAAAASPTTCYSGPECRLAPPAKDALDPALGRWLWGWSAARVGLPAECDLAPVA